MDSPKAKLDVPGLKVLEQLKRHLFDFQDSSSSPSKSWSGRDVCLSLAELTESVSTAAHRPNSSQLVSNAVELLVHACASQDRDIRLAAAENLRKMIKALMMTHLSRLQQDLFYEIKKNGVTRSLSVSLDSFAALFPLTRPSKCTMYASNLLPVLVRLTGRPEEVVLEGLQDALTRILPTMTPYLSTTNQQFLMTGLMQRFPTASATYRRMAASALLLLTLHARSPTSQAQWLISRLLDMGCGGGASSELVQGVLLSLQQLFSSLRTIRPPLAMLRQAYAFVLSCLLYRNANTVVSSLEALHQLLLCATAELASWLTTPLSSAGLAVDFWAEGACDTSDTRSQMSEGLETPCDSYFGSVQELSADPETTPPHTPSPDATVTACMALREDPHVPLPNLLQYLVESMLPTSRVSVQSLVLGCVTAAVDIQPTLLHSLAPIEPFISTGDPKLRSRAVKLLATLVSAHLRAGCGSFTHGGSIVAAACEQLSAVLADDTPVVLKAACEALQLCLPALVHSSEPQRALAILRALLPLRASSYWLTKVELLQTLACLDYTSLALVDHQLPAIALNEIVFPLLADTDHRVRTAVCEALVSLAPQMVLTGQPLLAHAQWEATHSFAHLHSPAIQLSLAGIGDSDPKAQPRAPLCLQHMLWFLLDNISSSLDQMLQRGCLEALHKLSLQYPPPSLPEEWGCAHYPCTTLATVQPLLESSRLTWGIQAHYELLELTSSLFLASALAHLQQSAHTGQSWCALGEPNLAGHASALLTHTARLLAVFVHIIEHREADPKEGKRLPVPGLPRRPSGEGSSPGKPKSQLLDTLQRPPLVPKDGIGQFSNLPHYLKIMDSCKAAYTNYQVSLSPVGEDKFSKLLQITHNTLAALLEVALAEDTRKHVEELLGYLSITVKVDPSGALLDVQQLLNALFGLNMAAQHTHLHSPYLSSLPCSLSGSVSGYSPSSLYSCTVSYPLSLMTAWLQAPPPSTLLSPTEEQKEQEKKRPSLHLHIPARRTLVVKPVNSVSSIKDYIGYFEPMVLHAVKQFPFTSSILLQQRVLFLIVQLIQLKVRYELLDCSHSFLDAVLKLVSLMETGMVQGAERLVPHLFQFLVLLAYDHSKLVTVPQVMQKCDGVMASGQNVTTFAIPALQPLVLNLFVRPSRETADLETQREVVLNMLLRLVDHSRIIILLTYVLECYSQNRHRWNQVSSQIYAALLPHIGKLEVVLDSQEALVGLYQLVSSMDPQAINMHFLFTALLKPKTLDSLVQLIRWLGVLCSALELMITIFPDSTLFEQISPLQFAVPLLHCSLAHVEGQTFSSDTDKPTQLASFLQGALHLAASTLLQLQMQQQYEDTHLLPTLTMNLLLLLQTLVQGPYRSLSASFGSLPPHPSLNETFLHLTASHPLLILHYISVLLHTNSSDLQWVATLLAPPEDGLTANHRLLHHCTLVLVSEHCTSRELAVTVAKSPILFQHCQTPAVRKILGSVGKEEGLHQNLVELLPSCDISKPSQALQALQLCAHIASPDSVRFLIGTLLPHPLPAIAKTAAHAATKILSSMRDGLSREEAAELVVSVQPHRERCEGLFSALCELAGERKSPSEEPAEAMPPHLLSDTWYVDQVRKLCTSPSADPEVCARLLGSLEVAELVEIVETEQFNLSLLEACLVRGLWLSRSRGASTSGSAESSLEIEFPITSQQPGQPHPLLQASATRLLRTVRANPCDVSLASPLVWLLISQSQLANPARFDRPTATAIATLALHALQVEYKTTDTVTLQAALDCCTLALESGEVKDVVGEEWTGQAVACLAEIVAKVCPSSKHLLEVSMDDDASAVQRVHQQLQAILVVLLSPHPQPSPHPLYQSLESLVFVLCRLPSLHSSSLLPPCLLGVGKEGAISESVLDQALMESEVLQQYMQRSNPIGWLSRPQFEERWMQLLGVVNQPLPPQGMPPEECHAHILNVCAGVQAVTSLLLSTCLRPSPGNAVFSVPMHTHRSNDVLFLGSRPGRKLAGLRRILELQLLLQCGERPNLQAYYQTPPLHHTSSPHYPPLYVHNLERSLGEASLGVGQMSLNSLWPIMLLSATSIGRHSLNGNDVDVRSCILSLVDLYSHWLSRPIHTLLLHTLLRSLIMLSDLFALSGQFDWLLVALLRLYESHPPEDTATLSFVVLGILKAAAVLKVVRGAGGGGEDTEKIAKIVERSLNESVMPVQNACLHGMLYLMEDSTSGILPLVSQTLAKYTCSHLQSFPKYPEAHVRLVWSVAVALAMQHSHHLKDTNFTGQLLAKVFPLLLHPHTSTCLFHSVTLGLEYLVINFTVTVQERTQLARVATGRFTKCDHSKSLAALALLITCMYTGEEADVLSRLMDGEGRDGEEAMHAREHVSHLMERLRHGPLLNVKFLVRVLPQLVVDLLPPLEVLQTVVSEFVSPHQTRPQLAARVMAEAFSLLLKQGHQSVITEWVLLSLDSFVQQEPESKAVWSITCLLTAASVTPLLRAVFMFVASQPEMPINEAKILLCTAAHTFYMEQCLQEEQQKLFEEKLINSQYLSLRQALHDRLHH